MVPSPISYVCSLTTNNLVDLPSKDSCCSPKPSHLKMTSVRSVLENNGLRGVLGLILSYLDPDGVKSASQVSR